MVTKLFLDFPLNMVKGQVNCTVDTKSVQAKKRKKVSSGASSTSTQQPDTDSQDNLDQQDSLEESHTAIETVQGTLTESSESSENVFTMDTSDSLPITENNMAYIIRKIQQSRMFLDVEDALTRTHEDLEELRRENARLQSRLEFAEGRVTRLEKQLEKADEKILDLTRRSMREDFIIKGIPESDPILSESEDMLKQKLMKVFTEKMKMKNEDIAKVEIERIHRLRKTSGAQARNVVMRVNVTGKATIASHIRNIPRGDPVKFVDQLPAEIHTRRNKLWPQFIQAKEAGKQAKFNVDKLVIDNKTVNPPKDKVNDINLNVTERAMSLSPKHASLITIEKNNHFQGHIVPIKSQDDVIPAIHALYKDPRVAGAAHVSYAYRVGQERYSISNYEDDGETGAGREIMGVLDQHNCYNCLVAVTRWHNGRYLGATRVNHVKRAAEDAVNTHSP